MQLRQPMLALLFLLALTLSPAAALAAADPHAGHHGPASGWSLPATPAPAPPPAVVAPVIPESSPPAAPPAAGSAGSVTAPDPHGHAAGVTAPAGQTASPPADPHGHGATGPAPAGAAGDSHVTSGAGDSHGSGADSHGASGGADPNAPPAWTLLVGFGLVNGLIILAAAVLRPRQPALGRGEA